VRFRAPLHSAVQIREALWSSQKERLYLIGEIDAVGGTRVNSGSECTQNDAERTVEFFWTGSTKTMVSLIGTTNFVESLDTALLRPGDLTNTWCPLPVGGRKILEMYAKRQN
jgi:ATP-dependent 26S proteasome regulatory subunit